jgi:uncharacterized OsmC-like protein
MRNENATVIRDLYDRQRRAMARRPSFGLARPTARVRLVGDLACEVEQEAWRTRVDEPVQDGGGGTAPHPGQLMRAAVGACVAVGYRVWGARLGVAIDDVEVNVVCELDARGQLGFADGISPGWQRIELDVRIASAAPETDVRRVVATADRLSPMLANLSPAIARVHKLTIVRPEA